MTNPKYLNSAETCKVLDIGRSTFYALVKSGMIPHIRIGRKIIVPVKELDEVLTAAISYGKEVKHNEPKTKTSSQTEQS